MGVNKYAGTQTEKNLLEAFSGESQARNKEIQKKILPQLQKGKITSGQICMKDLQKLQKKKDSLN